MKLVDNMGGKVSKILEVDRMFLAICIETEFKDNWVVLLRLTSKDIAKFQVLLWCIYWKAVRGKLSDLQANMALNLQSIFGILTHTKYNSIAANQISKGVLSVP